MEDAESRFLLAAKAILGDYNLEGAASVWVVALALQVDPATLSRTFDVLAANDYIAAQDVATRFQLTDKGRAFVAQPREKLLSEPEVARLKRIVEMEDEQKRSGKTGGLAEPQ